MLSVFNAEMIGACLHVGFQIVIDSLSTGFMDTKSARTAPYMCSRGDTTLTINLTII